MENNDRMLKELAMLDVVYQPWCIQYPQLELAQSYELKFSLIYLLPKFHGLVGEDPHKHLKEFHVVCSTMRLYFQHLGRYEAHVPREVLLEVQNHDHHKGNLWDKATFSRDFAPVLRKIQQISEQLLIRYFNESLTLMDRSMINFASGGALIDKMSAAARHLISNMASNTQQFGIKVADPSQMVNEVDAIDNLRLENQLTELTSLQESIAFVLLWSTSLTCTLHYKKPNRTIHRYGKQLYQSRQFDNQQFGRQQFRPSSSQGPYSAQRFGSAPSVPPSQSCYRQPSTTIPATSTIESAITRQLPIFGGSDEAVSNKQSGFAAKHEL
ncbi:hypothetical protein CR513_06978, partial [Mucuna pruriens]